MTNPFYNPSGAPVTEARGLSSVIRAEFAAVAAGFDLVASNTTGSFTPTYTAVPAFSVVSYDTQEGIYCQIGNMVFFTLVISTISITGIGVNGGCYITGLPLPIAAATSGNPFGGAISFSNGFVTHNPTNFLAVQGVDGLLLYYRPTHNAETAILPVQYFNGSTGNSITVSGFYLTE